MVPKLSPSPCIENYGPVLRAKNQKTAAAFIRPGPVTQSDHTLIRKLTNVYTGSINQSVILHQLFGQVNGQVLSEESLERIARRICKTWEPQQLYPPRLAAFVKFIKYVLSHTNPLAETYTLDSAMKACGQRYSAFPTIHAPLVLLLSLGYLERLSQKYPQTRGEPGCAQRLFLISYAIAAKYLHANLSPRPSGSDSPLLQYGGSGSSAFHIHPSQYETKSKTACGRIGIRKGNAHTLRNLTTEGGRRQPMSLVSNSSFIIMIASTNFLARLLPNVTTRELYRMEMEFLFFIDYDITVSGVEEVLGWMDLYGCNLSVKREEEENTKIKLEYEDEGIGHYESDDGGHAEDAMACGNMLM